MNPMRAPRRHTQSGVMLIEALIGILIFSVGILALIGLQAAAMRGVSDARYRTEAAQFANDLLTNVVLNVDRTSDATIQTSLAAFAHQASGTNCAFSGAASANAMVTAWVANVTGTTAGARPPLPGATSAMQQVVVDTSSGSFNRITITLCWKSPEDAVARRHSLTSFIN